LSSMEIGKTKKGRRKSRVMFRFAAFGKSIRHPVRMSIEACGLYKCV
jgi:hypothetical protein